MLASTNHTIVNSGYRPWRKKLIAESVELFELRGDTPDDSGILAPGVQSRFVSLHTKTFVIDREVVYIGSLNMDPRSFQLNTEMGLVVESAGLSGTMSAGIRSSLAEIAYRLKLSPKGRLQWLLSTGSGDEVITTEPQTSWWRRFRTRLMSFLSIEGQM